MFSGWSATFSVLIFPAFPLCKFLYVNKVKKISQLFDAIFKFSDILTQFSNSLTFWRNFQILLTFWPNYGFDNWDCMMFDTHYIVYFRAAVGTGQYFMENKTYAGGHLQQYLLIFLLLSNIPLHYVSNYCTILQNQRDIFTAITSEKNNLSFVFHSIRNGNQFTTHLQYLPNYHWKKKMSDPVLCYSNGRHHGYMDSVLQFDNFHSDKESDSLFETIRRLQKKKFIKTKYPHHEERKEIKNHEKNLDCIFHHMVTLWYCEYNQRTDEYTDVRECQRNIKNHSIYFIYSFANSILCNR